MRSPGDHGYFFWLYCVYFGVTIALCVLSLAHWPSRSRLVIVPRSPEDGYEVQPVPYLIAAWGADGIPMDAA